MSRGRLRHAIRGVKPPSRAGMHIGPHRDDVVLEIAGRACRDHGRRIARESLREQLLAGSAMPSRRRCAPRAARSTLARLGPRLTGKPPAELRYRFEANARPGLGREVRSCREIVSKTCGWLLTCAPSDHE